MSDDQELLRRVAQSDQTAMRELYWRYHDTAFGFIMSRGADHAEAADVVHDTMLEVWRSASKYSGKSSVKTWMFAIARKKLVDRYRKNSRLVLTDSTPDTPDDAPDPEAIAISLGESGRVRACLEGLKEDHRTAIRLAFYEDLSYDEISEVEEVPVGTVKTRIFHAKKLLMRCLGMR